MTNLKTATTTIIMHQQIDQRIEFIDDFRNNISKMPV